ncbi:MAG: hypothetical protein HKN70_08795 [Gammaproteobacteria bacterium]|nr:hypothetical protein [Gammaproteobacteria bacterium]
MIIKSGLAIGATLLLCSVAADNRNIDEAISTDSSAAVATIDDDAPVTVGAEADDATWHGDNAKGTPATGEAKRRPKTRVIVKTVAAEKNLVPEEKGPAEDVEVMICGRERIGTGSRLSRRVCRTVQQIEREAELRKAMVERNSNRFKRRPAIVGGRTAISDGK